MRIVVASGLTVGVLMFFIASAREEIADLGTAVMAGLIAGVATAGLVALWMWAL